MRRLMHALLSALLVPGVISPALAQSTGPNWSMPMHEWYWWWGAWHMLIPLLFLGALIAAVIVLVRRLWPAEPRSQFAGSSRALDLLDERYAKGEIEREEYLRRREDIKAHRG